MAKKKTKSDTPTQPDEDADAFDLEFKTNVVHYTVGKQGASRKVPIVMIVDASNVSMVEEIGQLLNDRQSFVKAVQSTKKCGQNSHVQIMGGDELFLITLSLKGKGPAKLRRDAFGTEGSVHRIKVTVSGDNAASAEIIFRTEGKSKDLAKWMVDRAGYELSGSFQPAQKKLAGME
jgi:hypothetical protein